MIINAFSISGLILGISAFVLCVILFILGKTKLHKVSLMFNIVVSLWGFGAYVIGGIKDQEQALLWWRTIHCAIAFIPVLNYHVVYELCGLKEKFILRLAYFQAVVFCYLSLTSNNFIPKVIYIFDSLYFHFGGSYFYIYFLIWSLLVGYAHVKLFQVFLKSHGRLKTQILYFFFGTIVGFSGGASNFLPALGINFYPFGNFTIPFYCFIVTYAILRYQLLDIKLVITRFSIFIVVYGIVLGFPFALAFGWRQQLEHLLGESWWMGPLISSTVLAAAGPYVYIFLQKRAEDKILQEQRAYQATLRKASYGMSQIKDIKKLLQLIVHVVTRSVRIEHCEIYLFHQESKNYVLKASKGNFKNNENNSILKSESSVIQHFVKFKEPIVYEEIVPRAKDMPNSTWTDLEAGMKLLDAALIVPSFIDQQLIAIFVLGLKKSKKVYSDDDLVVFSILANQSAIAIENAMSLESIIVYQKRVSEVEKAEQFSAMAQGMAHQINNRLHAMGMATDDKIDDIKRYTNPSCAPEVMELIDSLKNGFVRIKGNIAHATEIVQGFMKLGKFNKTFQFVPYNFRKLLAESIRMVRTKKNNLKAVSLTIDIPKKIPDLMGDSSLMKEVFFNLMDNAYDAIDEKRMILKDPSFVGKMELNVVLKNDEIVICFTDNGTGVKEENKIKFFVPMWTTKVSSRKGNGFGLFVIRTIIEKHGGKIGFTSKYMEGITFIISLPMHILNIENENTQS